ncbi:MAG TPA: S1C family serine protease [Verrucomicrobiae bacterium]|nr:S1C family serine protease [Verrucomicrobiae bacterium]
MKYWRLFLSLAVFLLVGGCSKPSVIQRGSAVLSIVVTDSQGKELSSGTGFWVSADGKLISNWHVMERAEKAYAKAPNGAKYEITGSWIADTTNDLVLLQSDAKSVPFLIFSHLQPKPGDKVSVLGSPLGFEQTLTEGLVSQKRSVGGISEVLQISAPLSPGSSGSPVFFEGDVVGVAVSKAPGGEGISFCIPSAFAVTLIKSQPSKSLEALGAGFHFVHGLPKIVRLPKASWLKDTEEFDYVDKFEAVEAEPGHKFSQTLTFYRTRLSPDRVRGLKQLSDHEYYEFFPIGLNDYHVLHTMIDFGPFWVLSRESFPAASITNGSFDLTAAVDKTRFQIEKVCR